jgi:hypothetical protein
VGQYGDDPFAPEPLHRLDVAHHRGERLALGLHTLTLHDLPHDRRHHLGQLDATRERPLAHHRVRPHPPPDLLFLIGVGGEHDDREERPILFDLAKNLRAGHVRHALVEDHELEQRAGLLPSERAQGFRPARTGHDPESLLFEHAAGELDELDLVVDEEDAWDG